MDSKSDQDTIGGLENAGDLEEETFGAEQGREKRGVGELDEKWEFVEHPECPYNLSSGESCRILSWLSVGTGGIERRFLGLSEPREQLE